MIDVPAGVKVHLTDDFVQVPPPSRSAHRVAKTCVDKRPADRVAVLNAFSISAAFAISTVGTWILKAESMRSFTFSTGLSHANWKDFQESQRMGVEVATVPV
jgi:hypothetical protein